MDWTTILKAQQTDFIQRLKSGDLLHAKAYSQAGIKDYWVLDVVKRELIVFRNPTAEGYQNREIITEHQNISPLDFPDLEIVVFQMLPLV
ncbi:Uma2 family endonuclease [Dolichospermum circinale]|uniref:Uma2 family endonuclease n=1 Tax=Dolichospermum circinale TaxID=109265 RepID=UPI003A929174